MQVNFCGLGSHDVGKYGPPVLVKERYLPALRKVRKGFDPTRTVCSKCYLALKKGILVRRLQNKKKHYCFLKVEMQVNRCGLGSHDVGKYGPPVLVKERYLPALRKVRKGFDPTRTVCSKCYSALKKGILVRRLQNKEKPSLSSSSASSSSEFHRSSTPPNGNKRASVLQPRSNSSP